MRFPTSVLATALAAASALRLGAADLPTNLLRNGSFEGSFAYWCLNRDHPDQRLVETDAADGRFALQLDKGFIWSAPFRLPPGSTVTLSASVRAVGDGAHCHFFLVPASRESGVEPFRVFWGKSGWGAAVASRQWQRLSWDIAIPDADFAWRDLQWWDRKGWFLFPTGDHVQIDGITVTISSPGSAGSGKDGFIGYAPVEAAVTAALPGYEPTGNVLDPKNPVALTTWLSNPGDAARRCTVRWQLLDYAGTRVLGEIGKASVDLAPHATTALPAQAALTGKGLMLARATVNDAAGTVLATSDQPLTALAFPKAPGKPDWRERFGGSVSIGDDTKDHYLLDVLGKAGFAWSRWYPQTGWATVQRKGPDDWNWPDAQIDSLERRGFSYNADLFEVPDWNKGAHNLPKDMDWKADDPKWADAGITTSWDRFIDQVITRYGARSIAWEVVNEPLWMHWDPALYTRLIERTSKRIKARAPKAVVMVDGCYGIDELHKRFLELGGAKSCDVFTFHNYGASGWFSSGDAVRAMHDAFTTAGHDVPVWFNEGWTFFPTSVDFPAHEVFADRGPVELAHQAVCAIADSFAGGMDKLILFHLAKGHEGRSWWEWGGDGTELWDDQSQPTIAIAFLNVASDQLGLSTHVATVRSAKGVFHVFQDDRHHRGVVVGWANEAGYELTLPIAGLTRLDVVGNRDELPAQGGKTVIRFAEKERPWYFSTTQGVDGATLAKLLQPFARPDVEIGPGVYTLPADWQARGKDGNPYTFRGKPIWRLGRLYPPDLSAAANFRTFGDWVPAEGKWTQFAESQGGNPSANLQGGLRITVATDWGGGDKPKPSTLSFIAPAAGRYEIDLVARSERWTGGANCWLEAVARDMKTGTARSLSRTALPDRSDVPIAIPPVDLAAGDELALVFGGDGSQTGSGCVFPKLTVRQVLGGTDQNRPRK